MNTEQIHIEASDVHVGMCDHGYSCIVWRINSQEACERLIRLEEILGVEYGLDAVVAPFDEIGALIVNVSSWHVVSTDWLSQVIADCVNRILGGENE